MLAQQPVEQPSAAEARARWGGPGVSDAELLLNFFTDAQQVAQMRQARRVRLDGQGSHGLHALIRKLGESRSVKYLQVRRGNDAVSMQA